MQTVLQSQMLEINSPHRNWPCHVPNNIVQKGSYLIHS